MIKKITAVIALVLLYPLLTFGASSPAENLDNTLAQIHTMQASFSQTIASGSRVTERLSGQFFLKKPGKFFWQTLDPIHQDIISDGKIVWIYDKDLEQVLVKPLQQDVGAAPALLLNGQIKSVARVYNVAFRQHNNQQIYTLKPKQKALYRYINMTFSDGVLTHMRFEDALGQWIDFAFQQVKVNQSINEAVFNFTPPPGVDVLNG